MIRIANRLLFPRPFALCLLAMFIAPFGGYVAYCGPSDPANSTTGPKITSLQIGFQGRYRIGYQTTATVIISAPSTRIEARIEVETLDGTGIPVRTTRAVTLSSETASQIEVLIKPGRRDSDFRVRIRDRRGRLLEQRTFLSGQLRPAMAIEDRLIVTIGRAIGIDGANALLDRSEAKRVQVAAYDRWSGLPHRPQAYDGVDWVILSTSDLANHVADEAAAGALREWVRQGGRLLISIGSAAGSVLTPQSPWAALTGAQYQGMAQLRQIGTLETYCQLSRRGGRSSDRSDDPHRDEGQDTFELIVAQLRSAGAVVELRHNSLPLVMRRTHGFGQVTLVAFDLDSAALGNWSGRGRLLNRLLGRKMGATTEQAHVATGQWQQHVYDDLSEQLLDALDQFDAVELVPFWLIASLVFVYLLLIGPLDYLLVHRYVRRPAATWFTFSLTVLLFATATLAARRWLKGDAVQVNQIDIVDVDFSGQPAVGYALARSTTWLNLYTPEARLFNLRARPDVSLIHFRRWQGGLSWLGDPGAGLGAMRSAAADVGLGVGYGLDLDAGTLSGVPIAAGSTKALVDRRCARVPLTCETSLTLDPLRRRLRGILENPFDVPLFDAVLFHASQAISLGPIAARARIDLSGRGQSHAAADLLRQRRTIDDQADIRYDLKNLDARRIAEVMMFHQAAGGTAYTHLSNRYQSRIDLSRHLQLGRAVLVALIKGHGAVLETWSDDDPAAKTILDPGRGRAITVVRFIFDVARLDRQESPAAR